jgi:hypothetical protein
MPQPSPLGTAQNLSLLIPDPQDFSRTEGVAFSRVDFEAGMKEIAWRQHGHEQKLRLSVP